MPLNREFEKAVLALDRLRKKARTALQVKKAERRARAQIAASLARAEKAGRNLVTVSRSTARALVKRAVGTKTRKTRSRKGKR